MSIGSEGQLLHYQAVMSSQPRNSRPRAAVAPLKLSSPRAARETKLGTPRAATALHRQSRRSTQQFRQLRRNAPSNFDKLDIVPTRYISPPRSPPPSTNPDRFPKLSMATKSTLHSSELPPETQKIPVQIPKLKCTQLPSSVNDESPQYQQKQKPHRPQNLVARPSFPKTGPPPRLVGDTKTSVPIPKLPTEQLSANLRRKYTGESHQSPQYKQKLKHRYPPQVTSTRATLSSVARARYPSHIPKLDHVPKMHRHVSDTGPVRRAPTAQARSRRSTAMHPTRPNPRPAPLLMPRLPQHRIVAHPPIDDFDRPPRTRMRNIGNPMPSQQPWDQTPNVAMMQMQIQQQQQQLLLQQQQLAIMQMQRDMERQTAETRARLLREPISVRDRSARLYDHSPRSHRRRSPLPSPRDRSARRRAPRASSPRHAASPRHDTAMRVVLSIEDVQLEEAIKCALIVRLAPGSKGRVDGVSNVDFQPQKTEVIDEVTDKPQFHSSTFCFRLPSTSTSTTCKFVFRLFCIDAETNERSVAGIGVLPVGAIGRELRESGGYKGTVPLTTKSGEFVGQTDICLICRD